MNLCSCPPKSFFTLSGQKSLRSTCGAYTPFITRRSDSSTGEEADPYITEVCTFSAVSRPFWRTKYIISAAALAPDDTLSSSRRSAPPSGSMYATRRLASALAAQSRATWLCSSCHIVSAAKPRRNILSRTQGPTLSPKSPIGCSPTEATGQRERP